MTRVRNVVAALALAGLAVGCGLERPSLALIVPCVLVCTALVVGHFWPPPRP